MGVIKSDCGDFFRELEAMEERRLERYSAYLREYLRWHGEHKDDKCSTTFKFRTASVEECLGIVDLESPLKEQFDGNISQG